MIIIMRTIRLIWRRIIIILQETKNSPHNKHKLPFILRVTDIIVIRMTMIMLMRIIVTQNTAF